MTTTGLVSEEMRGLIGRPFNEAVSYPVSESDIRKWAIAVSYPDLPSRLHWDADYAATTRFGGIVAPEDFNPFAWASAEPDLTHRSAVFDPDYIETLFGVHGPGAKANLNSGLSVVYGERIRPGDVISTTSSVSSYEEKTGRMGLMLFTTVRTVWTNQSGALVKTLDQLSIRY